MYEKRIEQLMLQRQNADDVVLLKVLNEEFSQISDPHVFIPFAISDRWDPETVQPILKLIDSRLIASPSDGKTVISI